MTAFAAFPPFASHPGTAAMPQNTTLYVPLETSGYLPLLCSRPKITPF
jgi:hypothetical protein